VGSVTSTSHYSGGRARACVCRSAVCMTMNLSMCDVSCDVCVWADRGSVPPVGSHRQDIYR